MALASAADADAATAAATVDAANAAMGEASAAPRVGWQPCRALTLTLTLTLALALTLTLTLALTLTRQPCRACRPLRGDELVGTRPAAAEGGGPSEVATSEAKRAWLTKQAVPSWRSRMPSP